MRSTGRWTAALLTAAVAAALTSCGGGSSADEGDSSASCVVRFVYEGRTYSDVADVEFTAGAKLGTATAPPCDDTGQEDEGGQERRTAYRVEGLSPEVAIAVGDTPQEAVFLANVPEGGELPPEVRELVKGS
ncbi:DUF6281 family protein [Streptomyces sp. NPDC051940]|uniref:DUF6281 family protein n=1 Tax=Streptomyces sp. NPDC051940 TaxID=3155675 RepID=UPI0034311F6C